MAAIVRFEAEQQLRALYEGRLVRVGWEHDAGSIRKIPITKLRKDTVDRVFQANTKYLYDQHGQIVYPNEWQTRCNVAPYVYFIAEERSVHDFEDAAFDDMYVGECRLYVFNVPFAVTEKDLQAWFRVGIVGGDEELVQIAKALMQGEQRLKQLKDLEQQLFHQVAEEAERERGLGAASTKQASDIAARVGLSGAVFGLDDEAGSKATQAGRRLARTQEAIGELQEITLPHLRQRRSELLDTAAAMDVRFVRVHEQSRFEARGGVRWDGDDFTNHELDPLGDPGEDDNDEASGTTRLFCWQLILPSDYDGSVAIAAIQFTDWDRVKLFIPVRRKDGTGGGGGGGGGGGRPTTSSTSIRRGRSLASSTRRGSRASGSDGGGSADYDDEGDDDYDDEDGGGARTGRSSGAGSAKDAEEDEGDDEEGANSLFPDDILRKRRGEGALVSPRDKEPEFLDATGLREGYAVEGRKAVHRLLHGKSEKKKKKREKEPLAYFERGPTSIVIVVPPAEPGDSAGAEEIEKLPDDALVGLDEVDMRGAIIARLRSGRGTSRESGTRAVYSGRWWLGQRSGRAVEVDAAGLYAGSYRHDSRWGVGTLRYADGTMYRGRFGPGERFLRRCDEDIRRVRAAIVRGGRGFRREGDDGFGGGLDGTPPSARTKGGVDLIASALSVPPLDMSAAGLEEEGRGPPKGSHIASLGLAALKHHPGGRAGVWRSQDDVLGRNRYVRGLPNDSSRQARILFADKSLYVGEMADGRVTGQGRFESPTGDVWEGQFKDGVLNGFGTHMAPDGWVEQGVWRDGVLEEKGVQMWGGKGGDLFVGAFHRGLREGRGRLLTRGGTAVYDGFFSMGVRNGRGTLSYLSAAEREIRAVEEEQRRVELARERRRRGGVLSPVREQATGPAATGANIPPELVPRDRTHVSAFVVQGRWRTGELQSQSSVVFRPYPAVDLHAERPPSLPTKRLERAIYGSGIAGDEDNDEDGAGDDDGAGGGAGSGAGARRGRGSGGRGGRSRVHAARTRAKWRSRKARATGTATVSDGDDDDDDDDDDGDDGAWDRVDGEEDEDALREEEAQQEADARLQREADMLNATFGEGPEQVVGPGAGTVGGAPTPGTLGDTSETAGKDAFGRWWAGGGGMMRDMKRTAAPLPSAERRARDEALSMYALAPLYARGDGTTGAVPWDELQRMRRRIEVTRHMREHRRALLRAHRRLRRLRRRGRDGRDARDGRDGRDARGTVSGGDAGGARSVVAAGGAGGGEGGGGREEDDEDAEMHAVIPPWVMDRSVLRDAVDPRLQVIKAAARRAKLDQELAAMLGKESAATRADIKADPELIAATAASAAVIQAADPLNEIGVAAFTRRAELRAQAKHQEAREAVRLAAAAAGMGVVFLEADADDDGSGGLIEDGPIAKHGGGGGGDTAGIKSASALAMIQASKRGGPAGARRSGGAPRNVTIRRGALGPAAAAVLAKAERAFGAASAHAPTSRLVKRRRLPPLPYHPIAGRGLDLSGQGLSGSHGAQQRALRVADEAAGLLLDAGLGEHDGEDDAPGPYVPLAGQPVPFEDPLTVLSARGVPPTLTASILGAGAGGGVDGGGGAGWPSAMPPPGMAGWLDRPEAPVLLDAGRTTARQGPSNALLERAGADVAWPPPEGSHIERLLGGARLAAMRAGATTTTAVAKVGVGGDFFGGGAAGGAGGAATSTPSTTPAALETLSSMSTVQIRREQSLAMPDMFLAGDGHVFPGTGFRAQGLAPEDDLEPFLVAELGLDGARAAVRREEVDLRREEAVLTRELNTKRHLNHWKAMRVRWKQVRDDWHFNSEETPRYTPGGGGEWEGADNLSQLGSVDGSASMARFSLDDDPSRSAVSLITPPRLRGDSEGDRTTVTSGSSGPSR